MSNRSHPEHGVCARCPRNTDLLYVKAIDEYLCEDCTALVMKDLSRVEEIDAMFEAATSWRSWMVGTANEREAIANKWGLEHKHQARMSDGRRTN